MVDLDMYRDAPAPQLHIEFGRQELARRGISVEAAEDAVEIELAAPGGGTVPLHALARIGVKVGNWSFFREGNARFMALKFNVAGRDIGSVVQDALAAVAAQVEIPEGYLVRRGGEWENRVVALHLTGIDLSISAAIGFIALLGQVALVGLLMLSAVETLRRDAGMALLPALVEAWPSGCARCCWSRCWRCWGCCRWRSPPAWAARRRNPSPP